MEQKKTLWIIAAAGAFLLVVLAAAGIMYSPAKNQEQAIRTATVYNNVKDSASNVSDGGNGWIAPQNDDVYKKVVPSESEKKDLYVFADNAIVYELAEKVSGASENSGSAKTSETIDLNLLKNEIAGEQAKSQNINITVNIPSEKAGGANENPASNSGADVKVAKSNANGGVSVSGESNKIENKVEVESNKNAASSQQSNGDYYVASVAKKDSQTSQSAVSAKSSQKSSAATPKTVSPSVQAQKKAEPEIVQYWVQVASYSNKKGSENARTILDSNKIPADIFTYVDNSDKMFFRVRVGPYTTKSEAEYWRSKINKIEEFAKAESYITSTRS